MWNHTVNLRSRLRRASSRRRLLATGNTVSSISRLIVNTRHRTLNRPCPWFWRQKDVKRRKKVEADRLSSLQDDLIHKILSSIGMKHIVEMSVLSSRWRYIWTSMPYLNFSSKDFTTLPRFSNFVKHVLSGRNNQVEVSSVNLTFRGKVSQVFVKKLLKYAFSHNVQQLAVTFLLVKDVELPSYLFSSQSLKHLRLTRGYHDRRRNYFYYSITPTSTWELPALTTLHLHEIALYDDNIDKCIALISKCPNLENLTLQSCRMEGVNDFSICHSRLSNLTLESIYVKFIKVVAPQLKNLSIRRSPRSSGKILISAPDLAYLLLEDSAEVDFSAIGFCSLEKLNLSMSNPRKDNTHKIVGLLQHFQSVKFLTLNLEIVERLSSSMELISHQPCPFADLKSLRIYPKSLYHVDLRSERATLSDEVKRYLLDSSPGAKLSMVTRKDIMAEKNAAEAQKRMAELQVHIEKEKANIDANMAHMHEQGKPQPETKMQLQTAESMVR